MKSVRYTRAHYRVKLLSFFNGAFMTEMIKNLILLILSLVENGFNDF